MVACLAFEVVNYMGQGCPIFIANTIVLIKVFMVCIICNNFKVCISNKIFPQNDCFYLCYMTHYFHPCFLHSNIQNQFFLSYLAILIKKRYLVSLSIFSCVCVLDILFKKQNSTTYENTNCDNEVDMPYVTALVGIHLRWCVEGTGRLRFVVLKKRLLMSRLLVAYDWDCLFSS